MKHFDRIIIGGGLFGLYALLKSVQKGMHVLLLEKEPHLFRRASYVNQTRVHCGMHYLRSLETAYQCASNYGRFKEEHRSCINHSFKAIYANASKGSQVPDSVFWGVLESLNSPYEIIDPPDFLNRDSVSACARVEEVSVDPQLLLTYYFDKIKDYGCLAEIRCGEPVVSLLINEGMMIVNGEYQADFVVNCTYASVNSIINLFKDSSAAFFDLRYELCEVAICDVADSLKHLALTVMDGPFFSLMPFGLSGKHSLTSVGHTPLYASEEAFPSFPCQSGLCRPQDTGDCNLCRHRPTSCINDMMNVVSRFMEPKMVSYVGSIYTVKPILKASETNDSRPTVIVRHTSNPFFYSVLSGKLSSVYELDSILS